MKAKAAARAERGIAKTVMDDVLRGDLRHSLGRDLRELYEFYLDEERRDRLASMGRIRRVLRAGIWLLRSLIVNLSPARRALLLSSILLTVLGGAQVRVNDEVLVGGDFGGIGFILLLVVLMLELKDKLLARHELELGRAVQLALLPPSAPRVPGWDVWLYTRPANDVGGDLVDAVPVAADRTGVLLGDVAGKGLGAALLMAKLQSTIRALAGGHEALAELGSAVNRILCRDGIRGRFASLCYLELRPKEGLVRLLNAGHMPPLVLASDGLHEPPHVALALGVRDAATYLEQAVEVEPGGLLILYSDGITEAFDAGRRMFGSERLRELVPGLHGLCAEEAGRRVLAAVASFVGDTPASDDLSLVVVRRLPQGG